MLYNSGFTLKQYKSVECIPMNERLMESIGLVFHEHHEALSGLMSIHVFIGSAPNNIQLIIYLSGEEAA
jgi:hypothetical protein